jgi:hypothetical protein
MEPTGSITVPTILLILIKLLNSQFCHGKVILGPTKVLLVIGQFLYSKEDIKYSETALCNKTPLFIK